MKNQLLLAAILVLLVFSSGCIDYFDMIETQGYTTQERAVARGDPTICKSATFPNWCITAVAVNQSDPTMCEMIKDWRDRESCQAQAKG